MTEHFTTDGLGENGRRGDWMMTRSGRRFYPLDPRHEDIVIEDIAWGLSNICRYNGHGAGFYSVAEHSVLLAESFGTDTGLARQALLHDAAEAYLGDIIRPLKRALPEYVEIEHAVERVIFSRFGLPQKLDPAIKRADTLILTDERSVLFDRAVCEQHGWTSRESLGVARQILGLSPRYAYENFMMTFERLAA